MNPILNAVLFQCVWFAAVAGAGAGYGWAGIPVLLVFSVWSLRASRWPRSDTRLMLMALLIGLVFDSALVQLGWVRFASPTPSSEIAPVWILVLWAGFALTVNHSLAFLRRRLILAAALGAIAGPLAYLGAARAFSAVRFEAPTPTLLALALMWALVMPLLLRAADTLRAREAIA